MLKINTAKGDMGVAWMLKHNGTAIPVKIHIYGAPGDLDSNAEAAIWMLKYSPYPELKKFLQSYIGYIASEEVLYTEDDAKFREELRTTLLRLPFNLGETVGMSKEEVTNALMSLVADLDVQSIYDLGDSVDEHSGDFVAKDLNEMYIRVRLNDEYNAASYNGIGYFRIGSTYKDWTDAIYMFVHDHPQIKKVVVERDVESDGEEGTNHRRVMIDNMDRDDFLSATKLPFLGSRQVDNIFKTCYDIISNGKFTDLNSVRANSSRITRICDSLKRENLTQNYRVKKASWATTPRNR